MFMCLIKFRFVYNSFSRRLFRWEIPTFSGGCPGVGGYAGCEEATKSAQEAWQCPEGQGGRIAEGVRLNITRVNLQETCVFAAKYRYICEKHITLLPGKFGNLT